MGMLMRRHANRHKPKEAEVQPATPPVAPTPTPVVPVIPDGHTPIPEDFPGQEPLQAAGILSVEQLREVDDLTSLKGIGPATAEKIHAALTDLSPASTEPNGTPDSDNTPPDQENDRGEEDKPED